MATTNYPRPVRRRSVACRSSCKQGPQQRSIRSRTARKPVVPQRSTRKVGPLFHVGVSFNKRAGLKLHIEMSTPLLIALVPMLGTVGVVLARLLDIGS